MKRQAAVAALLAATALPAAADIVDVRQGTNISVAIAPDGQTLLIDLLGGLWRLPVTGGGATMLSPPGSGIAQPRFSPDGRRAVVERYRNSGRDLWLIDLASGSWEQLTDTPQTERQPDFLQDGGGIVFTSDRGGRDQLWTLDLATGALRQLTDEPGGNRFPTVAPDGRIAYINRAEGVSSLRVLTNGPAGATLAVTDDMLEAPSWRPGSAGPVLVYQSRDADGSDLKLLIESDITIDRPLTRDEDVFVGRAAWLNPAEFIYAADGQLWRRGIASTERRPVHLFAGISVDPMQSAVGLRGVEDRSPRPALGIRDFRPGRNGHGAVFAALGDIWSTSGRTALRLTDDAAVDVEPIPLPESDDIVFLSDRTGSFDLWHRDGRTGALSPITTTAGAASQLCLTADGAAAYFVVTAGAGTDLSSSVFRQFLTAGAGPAVSVAGPFRGPLTLTVADDRLTLDGPGIRPGIVTINVAGPMLAPAAAEPPAHGTFEPPTWTVPGAEPAVIRVGRLFDGIGNGYQRHVDIHLADGRITDIVGRGRLPAHGRILDFSDATALPGMVDVHAHHPDNADQSLGIAWLLRGVTTVREIATNVAAATERAEAWASGRRPGPRLLVAAADNGSAGDALSPGPVSSGFLHALARTETTPDWPAVVLAGRLPDAGMNIPLSPKHATYQDTLAVLGGTGGYLSTGFAAALTALSREPAGHDASRRLISIVERAQRSFGRVAIGSDAPAVPYGEGFISEIEALVEAGVPAPQALRWATAGGAMALGLDTELGTLEPGKLADLVIVDGDPLNRVGDLRAALLVLKGGRMVSGSVEPTL